jgi:hypothetical protein
MNKMTTAEIMEAYHAQELEEIAIIQKKDEKIKTLAEQREQAIARKEKIKEIKSKILEKRKLMKEKSEVDAKVKRTLKEAGGEEDEIEDDEDIEDDEIEIIEDEEEEETEEEAEGVEEVEEVEDKDEVEKLPESKQAILKKIAERKRQDILKKIAERKEKAEGVQKIEEKKEKKEVRVGTLLEAVEGDKKRRFSVFREEKDSFYLKELGTGKQFKIKKEKVELTD